MLSASTCYGLPRRMGAWLPEPPSGRSPWAAATASPTWISPSASPTTCRSPTCSMTGRARSSTSSTRCSLPTSNVGPDHLPRVPVTGRTSVRPLDDAGGSTFVPPGHDSGFSSARQRPAGPRFPHRGPREASSFRRRRSRGTSSGGASSTRSTRARASSAGVSGRRSTMSAPYATMRSRLPASARSCLRCRRAATTTFQRTRWVDSRRPTSARPNLGRSGQPSRHLSLALMREGAEARLPHADTVAQRLAELR